MTDTVNIMDPVKTPFLCLRLVKTDSITDDVKSETVEFEYHPETSSFSESTGATKVKFGPKRARKKELPADMWQPEVEKFQRWGYSFVTTKKATKRSFTVDGEYKSLDNKHLQIFVEDIVKANDEIMKASYTKSIEDIPKECLDNANQIMLALQTGLAEEALTVKDFNALVAEFFTQFPLAVSKADNYFATTQDPKHFEDVISRLQEKLDNVLQQLRTFEKEEEAFKKNGDFDRPTILDANGISMRDVTAAEKAKILKYMSDQSGQYVRAWHIENHATEKRFQDYCAKEGLTEEKGISHLWHGTGFENIWSIAKSGLYLNPELIKPGVSICGKAFGYGLYFAPYCRKSMGYTSCAGARYRGSGKKGGVLLIFKVATGNPYYIYRDKNSKRPNHWSDFHKDHPKMHCTWAEGDTDSANPDSQFWRLCFDEVIVYQEQQATIEYVVQFSDIHW